MPYHSISCGCKGCVVSTSRVQGRSRASPSCEMAATKSSYRKFDRGTSLCSTFEAQQSTLSSQPVAFRKSCSSELLLLEACRRRSPLSKRGNSARDARTRAFIRSLLAVSAFEPALYFSTTARRGLIGLLAFRRPSRVQIMPPGQAKCL